MLHGAEPAAKAGDHGRLDLGGELGQLAERRDLPVQVPGQATGEIVELVGEAVDDLLNGRGDLLLAVRADREARPEALRKPMPPVSALHLIHLLRHAKSSWDEPELSDHERPLNERGRRAVALLRENCSESGVAPDLVLCSSAVRAIETLEGVRDGLPADTRVEIEAGLYGASGGELLAGLGRLPEETGSVMLVGHNPGIEDLASELAGGGDPGLRAALEAKYPTGGLATLAFEGTWQALGPGDATLEAFAVPRRLGV